jgi:uncharacterized protein (TIGR03435 family)
MKTSSHFGQQTALKNFLVRAGFLGILSTVTAGGCAHTFSVAQSAPAKRMPADADPSFEVATVKPSSPDERGSAIHAEGGRFRIKNQTLTTMLLFAYGVHAKQIVDAPAWLSTDRYDVDGVLDTEGEPSLKQMQRIAQKLLTDRFQLKFHRELREMPVYAITVAKGGPKLEKSKGDPDALGDENDQSHGGEITQSITNLSVSEFALIIQFFTDRPVVDQTGLTGKWDFRWTWTADESRAAPDADAAPGMFTAIEEQLGLKLDAVKAPADVFVVDHIEKPSAN